MFTCGWLWFYWYMNFKTFLNRQKNQFYMLHNANHHIMLELFFKSISKCAWLWSCTSSAGRWGWGLGYKLWKQIGVVLWHVMSSRSISLLSKYHYCKIDIFTRLPKLTRKQFKKWLTATESVLKLATEETKINVISCLLYH